MKASQVCKKSLLPVAYNIILEYFVTLSLFPAKKGLRFKMVILNLHLTVILFILNI